MNPHAYLTIGVRPDEGDLDTGVWRARGRLLSILHSNFSQRAGAFAVGLNPSRRPQSHGLRVFATTIEELEWLSGRLTGNGWIRDYAIVNAPRLVPSSFDGGWTSFVRYRIPTLKSDRKTGDEFGRLRARRLRKASEDGMDYFLLASTSTSQRFTLIIQRRKDVPASQTCLPNSYGFSTTTQPFNLPDIE